MKNTLLPILLILTATGASAHTGHIAEAGGHNHLIAFAALGMGLAVSLITVLLKSTPTAKPQQR